MSARQKRSPHPGLARIEADWRVWLLTLFRPYISDSGGNVIRPAPYHEELWEWAWAIRRGARPRPFVAIWPRGAGKSTTVEMICVALGARRRRKYALYVSETQEQADDHVQNVAAMLESKAVERYYPDMAQRLIGKYGHSKGWRRNRLRTANGFTLDAIGLDTAARGAKVDEDRPDLIILDDLDGELDGPKQTEKKIKTLTRKLLPAGAEDVAVLAVQNLILKDGIFAQLADGRADFLADRIVSGPHPALRDAVFEERAGRYVIVSGEPTWPEGMGLDRCQADLEDMGLTAFLAEKQHEVGDPPGGMFSHLTYRRIHWAELPELVRVVVWCDPAVTATDDSDCNGIIADGIAKDGTIYRLWAWEGRSTPEETLQRAILKAVELKAEAVGVETDQGGETWQSVYREALRRLQEAGRIPRGVRVPAFRSAKAGQGHGPKTHRASLMLADYEKGRIVHVIGTHQTLEAALNRFPKTKPFDLVDAAYWSWNDLRNQQGIFIGRA